MKRGRITFLILVLALLVFSIVNISVGSVYIELRSIFQILLGKSVENMAWRTIILDFRIPKMLTAIFAGAGLGLAGLQMQSLFRNALAGPFVLGVSSGASLGVAIFLMTGISVILPPVLNISMVTTAAFAGALLIFSLMIWAAGRINDPTILLILGLMVASTTGALVTVIQYFSTAEELQSFVIWTFGSLGNNSWTDLSIFIPLVSLGILATILLSKVLNALLLGEVYAGSMGLDVKRSRTRIILTTCLLAGIITAFCGPVAFIGLAVPHMSRMIFKTADHRILIPSSILLGAVTLLICDLLAQLPGSAQVLPINAVTSLVGAPFVIYLLLRSRGLKTMGI